MSAQAKMQMETNAWREQKRLNTLYVGCAEEK